MLTALLMVWGCPAGVGPALDPHGDDEGLDSGSDETAPVIEFEPLTDNQPSGEDVLITARITDAQSGVFLAALYFRNETDSSKDWQSIGFARQPEGDWVAKIAADEQHSSGMWYYLLALDTSQNEAVMPEQGPEQPYHFGYSD